MERNAWAVLVSKFDQLEAGVLDVVAKMSEEQSMAFMDAIEEFFTTQKVSIEWGNFMSQCVAYGWTTALLKCSQKKEQ